MASECGRHIPSRRARKLTEKSKAQYEENVSRKSSALQNQRKDIIVLVKDLLNEEIDHELFAAIREQLVNKLTKYNSDLNVLETYLNRINTEDSKTELCSLKMIDQVFREQIKSKLDSETAGVMNIDIDSTREVSDNLDMKSETVKTKSVTSRSRRSSSSKHTVVMLAEAEALKAKLQFAEKEHELKLEQAALEEEETILKAKSVKRQASLKAEIELLNQQKEMAGVEAKIETIRSGSGEGSEHSLKSSVSASYRAKRTERFILDQQKLMSTMEHSLVEPATMTSDPTLAMTSFDKTLVTTQMGLVTFPMISNTQASISVSSDPVPVVTSTIESPVATSGNPVITSVNVRQMSTVPELVTTSNKSNVIVMSAVSTHSEPAQVMPTAMQPAVRSLSGTLYMTSSVPTYMTSSGLHMTSVPTYMTSSGPPLVSTSSVLPPTLSTPATPQVTLWSAPLHMTPSNPYMTSSVPQHMTLSDAFMTPAVPPGVHSQVMMSASTVPPHMTSVPTSLMLMSNPTVIPTPAVCRLSADATPFIYPEITTSTSAGIQAPTSVGFSHVTHPRETSKTRDPVSQTEAFTTYLAKKDLNMARFSKFDDDPATYTAWKNSFQSIVKELHVRPEEEIDLLVRWLGTESSRQVLSLRTSNSHNPAGGLTKMWCRLEERYGAPELIENALKMKIVKFPRFIARDYSKLYNLLDILSEIQSLKEDPKYQILLSYYDSSAGINPVIAKLPNHLQSKWTERAARYKNTHRVTYPPFHHFVNFISEMASMLNDPSFKYSDNQECNQRSHHRNFQTRKTSLQIPAGKSERPPSILEHKGCPIHRHSPHKLIDCKQFSKKGILERKSILKENGLCFRCLENTHNAKECKALIRCLECRSANHPTCMHVCSPAGNRQLPKNTKRDLKTGRDQCRIEQGGEQTNVKRTTVTDAEISQPIICQGGESVNTKCTAVCGEFKGRSCAKIILVRVFPDQHPEKAIEVYAMLDDQSNQTLASPDLLNTLNVSGEEVPYTLSSCSGSFKTSGRRAQGYTIQSMNNDYQRRLPVLIECSDIPNERSEIATPEIVHHFSHLKNVPIMKYRPDCEIGLLIGRDIPDVHQVQEQITGPRNSPFAQRLGLGWVIVGDVCLGNVHKPSAIEISARKTHILPDGRGTIFEPCQNRLIVTEDAILDKSDRLFQRTKADDKIGTSVEDRQFLAIMEQEMFKNEDGNWTAPLPFRLPREKMPNNRSMAFKRAMILDSSLQRNPTKKEHFVAFMSKVLKSGAAGVAPPPSEETWYLPIFGVYHPQKPEQIRGVFDSSATYEGVSLNKCLLSGPNMMNELLGVLLRFRKDQIAFAADIEQMFYSFLVREDHRDFLRFFWYRDNNPDLELIEYRMRAHVFGNSPSPAVASYGLKKCVDNQNVDSDVKKLVDENFYVDDALASRPSAKETISLIERTQTVLKEGGNLRLHKIVSNSPEVIGAFPVEDLGKEVKTLQLDHDPLPTHRSLGLEWDMNNDNFKFDIGVKARNTPLSRRVMLSTLNSVYDPLGFIAPITIQGKIMMREITKGYSWDEPIDPVLAEKWRNFEDSIKSLKDLNVQRMLVPVSLSTAEDPELHIFSDASEQAVSAVAYLKVQWDGQKHIGFVMGKAKVAPAHGHTIPRLELCATVLATELAEIIIENLDVTLKAVKYYTDSKVVLGYINNKTRRFYVYVSNRVERVLKQSLPEQWNYVFTKNNPADCGTRGVCTLVDLERKWLKAPDLLSKDDSVPMTEFPLITPEDDKEIRVEVRKTKVECESLSDRFDEFSDWYRLVNVVTLIKRYVRNFKSRHGNGESSTERETREEAEKFLLRKHQCEQYPKEMMCLQNGQSVPSKSSIVSLSPIIDTVGVMRVGGRLGQGCLPIEETNPIIVPGKSHIAKLLVRHCHELVKHQGRLLTESSLRNHGFWIVGAKRLISSVIYNCVVCRKLRGQLQSQKMADLPPERLTPAPPFTSVGIDAFGPWNVVTRKTRGGSANSKRWAILFTCLGTRAVHIEVVEDMSTSSFINSLRRFIAIRGNVKELRSDRGTNFIGAANVLKEMSNIEVVNVEDGQMKGFLRKADIIWKFNPPHSSHMGGVWERMIGLARRILDAMFLEVSACNLTHEVLVTLMAEVSAIINSRPVAPISTDPEAPVIVSPATLLTQKTAGDTLFDNGDFDIKDLYREQWKKVKVLSELFWRRWREGYIQTLQTRRKWNRDVPNVKDGDVILLKDKNVPRREWCVGVVVNAIKSDSDGKVRKAEVRVRKEGSDVVYVRPVTEMVVLMERKQ